MFEILRNTLGFDIREFAGANAAGELPIATDLINRRIAERLTGHRQIAFVHVQTVEGDAAVVRVAPRLRLLPVLKITVRIERQPEFPHGPVLLLRWRMPIVGSLTSLAALVLSWLRALPKGITMRGNRIAIDLRELLRARGMEDALEVIRKLEIHTPPGAFVVQFELGINGGRGE